MELATSSLGLDEAVMGLPPSWCLFNPQPGLESTAMGTSVQELGKIELGLPVPIGHTALGFAV